MQIKIDIDESKILELAKTTSMDDLPRQIYYQAKKEAVDVAVNEIKNKLTETSYYASEEKLKDEVKTYLFEKIKERIKKLIEEKFNEKEIQRLVERQADLTITTWMEKKIYERLEALKKDIIIVSNEELEYERQAMEDSHKAEVESLQDTPY